MMKKITLKIGVFVLFAMSALQVQAQAILWCGDGTYKIGARGTNLFMTINGSTAALEWQEELPGDDPTQVWSIVGHRTPASAGLMEITANAGGVDWTMCMAAGQTAGYPAVTLVVEPRLPVEVLEGDRSGLDQFQRRKARVDANGDPDPNGANPSGPKNNALFIQLSDTQTNSRYGVIPSAAGDSVQFDGGGIDVIDYHLVALLSTDEFDTSSVFISNPVKDELSIEGLTQNIKQISVYDLLGKQVISSVNVDDTTSVNLDVSTLTTGMYIVKLQGENGASFTKKIVKE
jgi:hypothetical protein